MHGYGVFSWADGRTYEGEYVDDKKDIGTQEQTFALDFLYEKTDEGGLKTIDLCLEC